MYMQDYDVLREKDGTELPAVYAIAMSKKTESS